MFSLKDLSTCCPNFFFAAFKFKFCSAFFWRKSLCHLCFFWKSISSCDFYPTLLCPGQLSLWLVPRLLSAARPKSSFLFFTLFSKSISRKKEFSGVFFLNTNQNSGFFPRVLSPWFSWVFLRSFWIECQQNPTSWEARLLNVTITHPLLDF